MKVLGYNGGLDGYPSAFDTGHDSAAAIVVDGQVVAACEEERFTREKHTAAFPRNAIEYCVRTAGLRDISEVDLIVHYYSYPLMFHRSKYVDNRAGFSTLEKPGAWLLLRAMKGFNRIAGYNNERNRVTFERKMGVQLRAGQHGVVPHHLCHVASTYYDSPFESALCVTLDAEGESTSGMVALANGTEIKVLRQIYAPNSLGYFYALFTRFLGFDAHDEYKVMGLAPYGDGSRYREYFSSVVERRADGQFQVDPAIVSWLQVRAPLLGDRTGFYPRSITHALGPARAKDEPVTQRHMDIAASMQGALEDAVSHTLTHFRHETGARNLCLAGGVALNCTMNGKIARSGLFDEVYIHPAAHDSGTSVGAAMYGYHHVLKQPRPQCRTASPYLGPEYPRSDIDSALTEFGGQIKHSKPASLYDEVARAIAAGKVVGWYQGRMEWGPRALGNRSILADARRDDMKDVVNHAVKLREGFRPFAPACLAEHADAWFDMRGLRESPYMLFIVPVREDKRGQIPAVTHVDGSARVQTVTPENNQRFYELLTAFHRLTGVPVLLNTSFNVKGEPIVNTPADAVRCFLGTGIDMLVLDDVLIEKRPEVASALARERSHLGNRTGRVVDGQISMA